MAKQYRALISVHITANDDLAAQSQADKLVESIPEGSACVELVGEEGENTGRIVRVVRAEGQFLNQLPLDWKP